MALSKNNIEVIRRVLSMSDSQRKDYYERLSPSALDLLENLFTQYEELLSR